MRMLTLVCFVQAAAALSMGPVRAPAASKTLMRSLALPVELNGRVTTLRAEEGQEASDVAAEFLITHGLTGNDFDVLLPALEAAVAARGCANGRLYKLMDEMVNAREEAATSMQMRNL